MKIEDREVVARAMVPGDTNFIMSTWLRSAKDVSKMAKEDFFSLTRPQVEADVREGVVVVACDAEEPGTIYGWACYRDGVLRWAYVVFQLRNLGLLTFLKESYEQAEAEALAA